jgi:hypothetical protein
VFKRIGVPPAQRAIAAFWFLAGAGTLRILEKWDAGGMPKMGRDVRNRTAMRL